VAEAPQDRTSEDKPFRLLPKLDDDVAPFWTAGERGELVFWRCQDCGYWIHPPSPVCPTCLSRDIAVEATSGRGVVHSFTINEQNWNPTMPPPYVIALVELDAQPGLRLMTNIVNCDPADVTYEMPVRVVFEQHDDTWIPLFEPA
jgi:uncharacterized OB-fold protein